jgi:membrane-bound serine protease (ClpP class)
MEVMPPRRSHTRRLVCAAALLLGVGPGMLRGVVAQDAAPVVHVIAIDGVIDLGLAPFLARTIREAQAAGAAAVVLEINTLGGRVDAAIAMRDTLLSAEVPTIAFINQRAISAGALIALACETIVMTRGGTIGAAAPVLGGGTGETRAADEKTVSYVRKEFRATAEARNRPPEIAEAMVDADVEVPGLVASGKLLTLTSTEALANKLADAEAATLELALETAQLKGATLRHAEQTWAEGLVRFLTNPVVSSLLMTLGLLGLFVEIRTPGFALPGALGIVSLGLFFWGHWLVQLAGWEELLLVVIGVLLIGLELLVFPGITVAGVAGLILLIAGLGMTLVGAGATMPAVVSALGRVALSILLALVGAFALFRALPFLPFGRRLVLDTGMGADLGYVSAPEHQSAWLGRRGVTLSPLRPAGTAEIDGERVDVVSDGGFIEAGTPIHVTRVDGYRIVVRRLPPREESPT